MRRFLFPLLSLAACGASGAGFAPAVDIALICPPDAGAATVRLCAAVEAGLVQRGYRISQDPEVQTRLILDAESPSAAVLSARLTVERDGKRAQGELGQLTVADRASIPETQIDQFAQALLSRAPLPNPQP